MGANQSYDGHFPDVPSAAELGEWKERGQPDGTQQLKKKKKAKPSAPHRPSVTAVTHNAVSLTWLAPRHSLHATIAYTVEVRQSRQAKQWVTLTKNCQGTRYDARHLESDTEYVFRVRAENIFGTGKPSSPSDPVTTKIFEMSSDLNCYLSPAASPRPPTSVNRGFPKSVSYEGGLLDATDSSFDIGTETGMVKSPSLPVDASAAAFSGSLKSNSQVGSPHTYGNFRRRHSFNVQLDGRVSSILNHSDRFHSTNSLNSSTSTIVMNSNGSCNNVTSNDTDNAKTKSRSILRNNIHRTSLQLPRKTSIPTLLPGAGSNSLNRLRESRMSLKSSSSSDAIGSTTNTPSATPRHRCSMNRNGRNGDFRNSLGSTASDSTTTTSSTSSSSTKDTNSNKMSEGSRLSLQSALSDVTMSTHSQSSDDSSSSRPISFSDAGEVSDICSFLNGSSDKDSSKFLEVRDFLLDNDKKTTINGFNHCRNEDEEEDAISRLKRDIENMEITEEKLKFHDLKERLKIDFSDETCFNNNNNNAINNIDPSDYYQSLGNPWEKGTNSVNSVSENIMAAPFSDDIKIALNAKHSHRSDDVTANGYPTTNQNWNYDVASHDRDDFRTLRSVLQSNHLIVKQSRSMPEVVGVVLAEGGETRTLTRGKLTTIEDEDEDEEAVRVTTL